jgi:probable HAF family extracellular repeat protein
MVILDFLARILGRPGAQRRHSSHFLHEKRRARPRFELLEDRCLLSSYAVTDLGTLGGASSSAYGINASEQVVGHSLTAGGLDHAFVYGNGTMNDLTPLLIKKSAQSTAVAIDNAGEAVGWSAGSNPYSLPHSYASAELFMGGKTFNLPPYPAPGYLSFAHGINASGQVVGSDPGPFLWIPTTANGTTGTTRSLGTLGGSGGTAWAINDSGQVVGDSTTPGGADHAFLYSNGKLQDLGTLPGGSLASARGINSAGQVVGYSDSLASPNYHAFLWQNGRMTDLGTLPTFVTSEAFGINASGQVIGTSFTASGAGHAFVDANGVMQDLNNLIPANSGWTLLNANAISEHGVIVGDGTINGQTHAFLLTPTATPNHAARNASAPVVGSSLTVKATSIGPYGSAVQGIAIDPRNPERIYAATLEGVIRSTDGGGSWSPTTMTQSMVSIVVDPKHPATLYAGAGLQGLFKSTDGGDTWSQPLNPSEFIPFVLAVDPNNSAIVYEGGLDGTLWKSTDEGQNWNAILSTPNDVWSLAIDPRNSQALYVSTEGSGIYKSTDGGATWSSAVLNGQIIYTLAIDPNSPDTLYAGTAASGVLKSTDGGATWSSRNQGLTVPYISSPPR